MNKKNKRLGLLLLIALYLTACTHVYRQSELLPIGYSRIDEKFRSLEKVSSQLILEKIDTYNREQPPDSSGNEYDIFCPPKTITTPFLYPLSKRTTISRLYNNLGYAYLLENDYQASSVAFYSALVSIRNAFCTREEREFIICESYKGLYELALITNCLNYAKMLAIIINMEDLILQNTNTHLLTKAFYNQTQLVRSKQLEIERTIDNANRLLVNGIFTAIKTTAEAYASTAKAASLNDNSTYTRDMIAEKFAAGTEASINMFTTSMSMNALANTALSTDADGKEKFVNDVLSEYQAVDPFRKIISQEADRLIEVAFKFDDQYFLKSLFSILRNSLVSFVPESESNKNIDVGDVITPQSLHKLVAALKGLELHLYKTERIGRPSKYEPSAKPGE